MRRGLPLLCLLITAPVVLAQGAAVDAPCATLIHQSNAQLEAMRRHAASIEESLQTLSDALLRAEARNAEQTREIERLEAELRAQRAVNPQEHDRQRREFFRELRRRLNQLRR